MKPPILLLAAVALLTACAGGGNKTSRVEEDDQEIYSFPFGSVLAESDDPDELGHRDWMRELYALRHSLGELTCFASDANFPGVEIEQAEQWFEQVDAYSDSLFRHQTTLDRPIAPQDMALIQAAVRHRGDGGLECRFEIQTAARIFNRTFRDYAPGDSLTYYLFPFDERWDKFALLHSFSGDRHIYFFASGRIVAYHDKLNQRYEVDIHHYHTADSATVVWYNRMLDHGTGVGQHNHQFYRYAPSNELVPVLNELAFSYSDQFWGIREHNFSSQVVRTDTLTIRHRWTSYMRPRGVEEGIDLVSDSADVQYLWNDRGVLEGPMMAKFRSRAYYVFYPALCDRLFLYSMPMDQLGQAFFARDERQRITWLCYLDYVMCNEERNDNR